MKRKELPQILSIALFWGGCWGFTEATLGYILHMIPFGSGISGMLLFPIAFYFMRRAFLESNNSLTVILAACFAAGIKLVDLLLPHISMVKVINPAASILLEALAIVCFLKITQNKHQKWLAIFSLMLCFAWKIAFYLLVALPIFLYTGKGLASHSGIYLLRFFLFDSLINAVLIFGYLKIVSNKNELSIYAYLKKAALPLSLVIYLMTIIIEFMVKSGV